MSGKDRITTVDAYIATFPDNVRERLEAIRTAIHAAAPGTTETISYNLPTFVIGGSSRLYVAAWKQHIALYPITTEMEASIPAMADYSISGKGTIQFPHARPLPLDLIREIAAHVVSESRAG